MNEYTLCLTTQGVFVRSVWLNGDTFLVPKGRIYFCSSDNLFWLLLCMYTSYWTENQS